MATIEQRPNGTWRTKIRKKGYPSLSASFDTKAEAQRWDSEVEGDMSRKRFVDTREADSMTIATALARYAREVSAQKKGAHQLVAVQCQPAPPSVAWLIQPLESGLTQRMLNELSPSPTTAIEDSTGCLPGLCQEVRGSR
jgi:hypothetical protein